MQGEFIVTFAISQEPQSDKCCDCLLRIMCRAKGEFRLQSCVPHTRN